MEKMNVLFLCPEPLSILAMQNIFCNEESVCFTALKCTTIDGFQSSLSENRNIVIIEDSLINEDDFQSVIKIFSKIKDNTRLVLLSLRIYKFYINPLIYSWFDFFIDGNEEPDYIKELILHAAAWAKPDPGSKNKILNKRFKYGKLIMVLTSREYKVFKLIGSGYSNKEIADLLGLSVKTIESFKANIIRKLGLNTSHELLKFAVKIVSELLMFFNILALYFSDIDLNIF